MIVLESTLPVVESARLVRIDDAAVAHWADAVRDADLAEAPDPLLARLPGDRDRLANFTLLVSALNFCFWSARDRPPPSLEWEGRAYSGFNAMLVALIAAATADPSWFSPQYWCDAPSSALRAAIDPAGQLPMMAERERIVRETGRTLLERFDGRFAYCAESVNLRAWDLAALLLVSFDSFRDVAGYRNRAVYLAKRAQITALDLSRAWQAHGHGPLDDLDRLTAFADYRIPQALRHLGILVLAPEFAASVDGFEEIPAGSEPEIELRAASIQAAERMRAALAARGRPAPAWRIDAYLWRRAHDADVTQPHHRTRTIFY